MDLPDDLFRQAKARAALDGISLRDLVEIGVRLALEQTRPARKLKRLRFPLHRSKKPGSLKAADFCAAEAAVAVASDLAHTR